MVIYNQTGDILLNIPVDDNSYRYRAIRQGDKVYLYFSLAEPKEIPVYSYIEYQGQRYTLWRPEDLTKHGTRNLEYAAIFGGDWELLNVTKYKHLSAMPHRLKFQLTGNPRFFLQLLVDNLNQRDSDWTVGTCIEATEKTLAFSHEFCLDVLNRFADEWETEFEFAGKTINFGKVERYKDDPLPLAYGRGNGLKPGVGRKNQGDKAPVSILYVQGGEKNIDPTKYGSDTLLLPKSQELEYEGRRYKTDKDGMYITRADRELPNRNEDSYDASHIYPSRVGTVSEVITVDAEKNLYDFKDSSIPDGLDYSACRIPGERATVIFQSGVMAGEEFDLEQTDDELTGYVHAERRFKLVPVEKAGGIIPNEHRKPAVGDKYAVFNISLPAAYVCDDASKTGASWDMFKEAVRYLYEHEEETFSFSGELDGIWSKSRWLEIGGRMLPGSYILFSDPQFQPDGIRIRITGIKDFINRPYSPEIELSNTPVAGFVSSDLGKIDSNEVKDEDRYQGALHYTKRRWRDAIEAQEMLEKAFDNYTKGIDPIWVRTMSLLVGDESLQFRFVNSKTNPQTVEPDFVYDDATEVFNAPKSILQHMTLGISEIKGKHAANEYKYWDIPGYTSPPLGDFGRLYFYAKCNKSGTAGEYLLTETPYKMDTGGYYYFLIGLLGSQFDGVRSYASVYGMTEILPGRITVDRIVSTDGKCYFNLGQGEIGGKIVFKSGSNGLKNLDEWEEVARDIQDAQTAANNAQKSSDELNEYVDGAFKDGVVTEAEAKAIEKYLNVVKASKSEVEATYNKLYANAYLSGSAKTGLLNAKVTLFGAIDTLLASINMAISDGKATESEKKDVDAKFSAFNTALSSFNAAVETANKAIQDALKGYSDEALEKANDALSEAERASNAANDAQDSADNAQSTANSKAQVFYQTTAPKSGMKTNDLWVDGVNIYRYDGSTWVFASKYDNTQTEINGGLITTGAIAFGSTGGMAGSGTIRIWSGGNSGSNGQPPASPTFRVDSSGNVESRGNIYIANANGKKLAGFSGSGTADSSIRIWAGNETPGSAPFRVTQNGAMYASKGKVGAFNITDSWLEATSSSGDLRLTAGTVAFYGKGIYSKCHAYMGSSAMSASSGANAAAWFKNAMNSNGYSSNGQVLLLECGNSKYQDVPQNWIRCKQSEGWGAELIIGARYFGDQNSMTRTCIQAYRLMSKPQVERITSPDTRKFYRVEWEETSGCFCYVY